MFNPRHSFISTSSATTYPSTLSPPRTSSVPLASPTSQNHPHRLHRSSKRNLRPSASSSALKAIVEDGRNATGRMLSHRMSSLALGDSPNAAPAVAPKNSPSATGAHTRPSSHLTPVFRPPSRPASSESVQAWAQKVNDNQRTSSRPTSTAQTSTSTVRSKPSRDLMKPQVPTEPKSQSQATSLGLVTAPPDQTVQSAVKAPSLPARVAQPRRPEPVNVNPGQQDSFANEWERELIQSAKNPHFQLPDSKGKGREVQKDIEWERSGRWQADVDPTREAEDLRRRDNGREIGESTSCLYQDQKLMV
jgi:hypothetical protein